MYISFFRCFFCLSFFIFSVFLPSFLPFFLSLSLFLPLPFLSLSIYTYIHIYIYAGHCLLAIAQNKFRLPLDDLNKLTLCANSISVPTNNPERDTREVEIKWSCLNDGNPIPIQQQFDSNRVHTRPCIIQRICIYRHTITNLR